MKIRMLLLVLLGAAALFASGCSSLGYYFQAASGQLNLLAARRPLAAVLADPATAPALRARIERARHLREFASRALALPDNQSYTGYSDLGRPYAVWNVIGADALSVDPKQWCYPIAGCVSYRGYFDAAAAKEYAAQLAAQGLDVHSYGVPAYSTLGWFADPLLNTFINWPDTEIARLLFHELAHQVAYAKNDSEFNESFAVSVEQEGMRRWLAAEGTEADRATWARMQAMRADFTDLVLGYRERLRKIYASDLDSAGKLAAKQREFAAMAEHYARLKRERWQGYAGYDAWFGGQMNNATLASVSLYTRLVPDFERLLAAEHNDLPRFYARVRELAELPRAERLDALKAAAAAP
ncbi:MAG: aminopeptidase [Rhodocyclaceae bacterium]|nr:aminopeptidase [Rhodocyclaceae bacterium]